jgi:hypothetical protein
MSALHSPNRAALAPMLALAAGLLGCNSHGVSLGAQEPCVADARLTEPKLLSGSEVVSSCAIVGDNALSNAGFETPVVGACEKGLFCQFPAADVPAWQTTDEAQVIEIWNDGHRGVPSYEAAQFVELNATVRSTVWQDVALTPGQLMYWSLAHHGRVGVESFELQLGPPEALSSQALFTSAEDAWYQYSGLYRVGGTETLTRFALVSRIGTNEGNLIDATVFAPVDER